MKRTSFKICSNPAYEHTNIVFENGGGGAGGGLRTPAPLPRSHLLFSTMGACFARTSCRQEVLLQHSKPVMRAVCVCVCAVCKNVQQEQKPRLYSQACVQVQR